MQLGETPEVTQPLHSRSGAAAPSRPTYSPRNSLPHSLKGFISLFSFQIWMHPRTFGCLKLQRPAWPCSGSPRWPSLTITGSTTAFLQASQWRCNFPETPHPLSWEAWNLVRNTPSSWGQRRAGTRASPHAWRRPQVRSAPELPTGPLFIVRLADPAARPSSHERHRRKTCCFLHSHSF